MKALKKLTIGAVGVVVAYWAAKFAWILFWDILLKIIQMLQTAVMITIVLMAIYVLWKILGYKSSGERD
jgi:hypothetical protein